VQVITYLRNFLNATNRLTSVPQTAALQKMKEWFTKLDLMSASANISQEDKDQMILDIDKLVNEISKG
jgi:HAMP domain-containing protein